jgi:hypothetical protein
MREKTDLPLRHRYNQPDGRRGLNNGPCPTFFFYSLIRISFFLSFLLLCVTRFVLAHETKKFVTGIAKMESAKQQFDISI